jgi:glycosyltransferase involved in cell wall biosynthesis
MRKRHPEFEGKAAQDVIVALETFRPRTGSPPPVRPAPPLSQSVARTHFRKPIAGSSRIAAIATRAFVSFANLTKQSFFVCGVRLLHDICIRASVRALTFSRGLGHTALRKAIETLSCGLASISSRDFTPFARLHFESLLATRLEMLQAAGLPPPIRPSQTPPASDTQPMARKTIRATSNGLALIATRNFMPFAKLTAQTFLDHHSDFTVFLLLVDGEESDRDMFTEGHVILLPELQLDQAGWYSAKLTASEFSNALKPVFLRHLAGIVETVIYLDCDVAVFSRLTEMIEAIEARDLVLVPHMLSPLPRPEHFWARPRRADIFNSGLINAGCFAINPIKCRDFLTFWEEANFAPGAFYENSGYQTDQHHLNWALVSVPNAIVLREPRYNVAYWNLHDRDFRFGSSDCQKHFFQVDGRPLGCFHFSGYNVHDRLQLSIHDNRHSVYELPAVAEILNWYSDRILSCPTARLLDEPYRFDWLANGFRLNELVRRLLKEYEVYFPHFDSRTQAGADGLCAFLMDPLPARGSLLPLVAAEIYEMRSDLKNAFPGAHTEPPPSPFWRWFCRHAGVECDIQFLIDRFRRVLMSDSVVDLTARVAATLGTPAFQFLGAGRSDAASHLHALGALDLVETLLEARAEWCFFTDVSAALTIYKNRSDLQEAFPDILDQDHKRFCLWLNEYAPTEHAAPPRLGDKFSRYSATASLARVFSYLSTHEHVCRTCQDSLLLEDSSSVLQWLVREAGEGLGYDLDDVIVLQFIHQSCRYLLVPLYLELPLVRRELRASRVGPANRDMLPPDIRNAPWAIRGCILHASYFDKFEACLDEEMRRWHSVVSSRSQQVTSFLRRHAHETRGFLNSHPAYQAAARRQGSYHPQERELRPGVNIFGYFTSDIGLGESSRGLAEAVSLLRPVNRIPLCTMQLKEGTGLSQLFQRFDYSSDTNIFVTYPHQREDLLEIIRAEQLVGRRNIAHLAWEQKDINRLWKDVYDRYDEIWAISEFAAAPFRKIFPDRVTVVPNVLDFGRFPNVVRETSGRSNGDLLNYLFVFNANSSIERKNPEGVIDAFTKAFKGTEHASRVQLTLRIQGMNRPEHSQRVEHLRRKACESGLSIRFDGSELSREAALMLLANADCYVSLHRAEGFGYTMAEAMFYGVPVVASGYSGNLDYMNSKNSFLVPCRETFVRNADGPFQRGSIWGDPDIDIAADLMRHVAEAPSEAAAVGQRGRKSVLDQLSASAVAERIRSRLSISSDRSETTTSGRFALERRVPTL